MLEFVSLSGEADGKDLQTRRKVRSQAMRDYRRRQRAEREAGKVCMQLLLATKTNAMLTLSNSESEPVKPIYGILQSTLQRLLVASPGALVFQVCKTRFGSRSKLNCRSRRPSCLYTRTGLLIITRSISITGFGTRADRCGTPVLKGILD